MGHPYSWAKLITLTVLKSYRVKVGLRNFSDNYVYLHGAIVSRDTYRVC